MQVAGIRASCFFWRKAQIDQMLIFLNRKEQIDYVSIELNV